MSEKISKFEQESKYIKEVINAAVEVVASPGENPLEVFPDPGAKDRRADVRWGGHLSSSKQLTFRALMRLIGPGRENNIGPDEFPVLDNKYDVLFHGGQPRKIIAEKNLIVNAAVQPHVWYLSGSSDRNLPDGEQKRGGELLGIDDALLPTNEMLMGRAVARTIPGFYPCDNQTVEVLTNTRGDIAHLETIGAVNGRNYRSLDVLRQFIDGGPKYTRFSNADKLSVVVSRSQGRPVLFATSATYKPGAILEAARVEDEVGVPIYVATFGTQELARIDGVDSYRPSIDQLGAEAFKTAKLLKV